MTLTTAPMSLADFFAYTEETEIRYELENGALCEMPPESDLNRRITSFLFAYFLRAGIAPEFLSMKTEVA
ncbi:MAG: Uma2 family endonuclease, partial [Cyanobacteria bacterium P01_C01_bin.70]